MKDSLWNPRAAGEFSAEKLGGKIAAPDRNEDLDDFIFKDEEPKIHSER